MKCLEDAELTEKRVLLRLDLNAPLTEGDKPRVLNDYRLRAVIPTLNFLLNRQAKIIILAHLGRPNGRVVHELSLRPVYLHLSALLKRPISFAQKPFSVTTKEAVEKLEPGAILGLENLRFDPGEGNDSRTFARKLASLGELYVNDAFADSHRHAASIVAITEFLPSYPGLLLEKEVLVLTNLMRHPARPFVGIIGGAKVEDKLPTLKHLIARVDRLLVAGGVANTIMASQGVEIRDSLIEKRLLEQAKEVFKRARGKIVLPTDFVWHDNKILDLGPQSIEAYKQIIQSAKTIFWAGPLGEIEIPKFAKGSEEIAYALADSRATTVVGGGNTIEILGKLKLMPKISFVSTGGSSTLELLAGKKLPGIEALN